MIQHPITYERDRLLRRFVAVAVCVLFGAEAVHVAGGCAQETLAGPDGVAASGVAPVEANGDPRGLPSTRLDDGGKTPGLVLLDLHPENVGTETRPKLHDVRVQVEDVTSWWRVTKLFRGDADERSNRKTEYAGTKHRLLAVAGVYRIEWVWPPSRRPRQENGDGPQGSIRSVCRADPERHGDRSSLQVGLLCEPGSSRACYARRKCVADASSRFEYMRAWTPVGRSANASRWRPVLQNLHKASQAPISSSNAGRLETALLTARVRREEWSDEGQQQPELESGDYGRGDPAVGKRNIQGPAGRQVGEAGRRVQRVIRDRAGRIGSGSVVAVRRAAGAAQSAKSSPGARQGGIALDSARACFVESGFRLPDCTAVLNVIRRRAARAGVPFASMLMRYTALKANNARVREIRGYPDGDVPGKSAAFNARWQRLREHAAAVLRGEVAEVCPRAVHWGSRTVAVDVRRAKRAVDDGRWLPARCKKRLANAYYVTISAAVAAGGKGR